MLCIYILSFFFSCTLGIFSTVPFESYTAFFYFCQVVFFLQCVGKKIILRCPLGYHFIYCDLNWFDLAVSSVFLFVFYDVFATTTSQL